MDRNQPGGRLTFVWSCRMLVEGQLSPTPAFRWSGDSRGALPMSRTARRIIAPAACALFVLVAGNTVVTARAPTAPHMAPIPPIPPIPPVAEARLAPLPPVPPRAFPAIPTPPRPPEAPASPAPDEAIRRAMAEAQAARRGAMKARAEAQAAAAEARRAAFADDEAERRRMLDDPQLGLALNQARASITAAEGMKDTDRRFALDRIDRALACISAHPPAR